MSAAVGALLALSRAPALAAPLAALPITDWGAVALGGAGIVSAAVMLLRARASEAALKLARQRLGDAEVLLNQAEAALNSESQILLTWPANTPRPERMVGVLHGLAELPGTIDAVMDFPAWLERDSASRIAKEIALLREKGTAFNFGVKTLAGDLFEVDGRAAGTMSALRFRPLTGQRLENSETLYDAHKLARQVQRLSAILDLAPFPIWLADKRGQLSWINRAYVDAAEAGSMDEVLNKNVALAKPEAIDRGKSNTRELLLGRAKLIHRGSPRALNIYQMPAEDGIMGIALDVTALEETEKELDRHIKAHASTLNKLSTAIVVFGPDQRLRFYNQAYAQLWQLDERFLAGHPADGEVLDKLRGARLLPEQANYREWRAKQLQAYSKIEPREEYWYLPDGRSLRVIAEQHPFGGVTYLYENLTKEYQLESRYNELFEVQRETLDNLAEAVALSGPDGRLRLFNPAFMRFWSLDQAFLDRKPHVSELAQRQGLSADSKTAWADIKFTVTGLEAKRKEHEGRIEQDDRVLRYRAVPLPDGNALLTFSDISDSVRAERALRDRAEALEAADKLKNTILSNVSYEVRTPLNSIIGFSEALDLGMLGQLSTKQSEYVGAIRQSSEHLKHTIDAIIDLSAIDAGQMELKLEKVDVSDLLEKTAEKFVATLDKRKLDLSIEVASDVATIIGDATRLEQILAHLLSNAAGFSAAGGQIRMGARKKSDMVQIWVADSGRGIDPDFQPKVFERFQSKPLPGSHRGAGLGLALVKSFTELHGGNVSLVSKLDKGTTVVCTLPIAGPARAARPALKSSAA